MAGMIVGPAMTGNAIAGFFPWFCWCWAIHEGYFIYAILRIMRWMTLNYIWYYMMTMAAMAVMGVDGCWCFTVSWIMGISAEFLAPFGRFWIVKICDFWDLTGLVMVQPKIAIDMSSGWWFGTFYVSMSWECHHPNWRTKTFFRGGGRKTTKQHSIVYA